MILLHVRVEVRVNAGDGAVLLLLPYLLDRLVLLLDQVLQVPLLLNESLDVVALSDQHIPQLIVLLTIVTAYLLDFSQFLLSWAIDVALDICVMNSWSTLEPGYSL